MFEERMNSILNRYVRNEKRINILQFIIKQKKLVAFKNLKKNNGTSGYEY